MKEIVRGKAREKKSPDLARGFEMKEKVKVVKNIDIAILKCCADGAVHLWFKSTLSHKATAVNLRPKKTHTKS